MNETLTIFTSFQHEQGSASEQYLFY